MMKENFLRAFGPYGFSKMKYVQQPLPTPNIEGAAKAVASAKRIVVMTGAGASAESGIPTYRNAPTSYWKGITGKVGMMLFGTPIGWKITPKLAWNLYINKFLVNIVNAKPNNGHLAIAKLEKLYSNVTIITTNVDGLHQAAGNKNVHELHGTVHQNKCRKSGHVHPANIQSQYQSKTQPICSTCQSPLQPNVVLFFEPLHQNAYLSSYSSVRALQPGDVFIVVGTSLKVAPASELPYMALLNGASVIEVNEEQCMDPRSVRDGSDTTIPINIVDTSSVLFLKGTAGEILPKIIDLAEMFKQR